MASFPDVEVLHPESDQTVSVLLVSLRESWIQSIRSLIESDEFAVAEGLASAIEIIRRSTPDLIISDFALSDITCSQFCRRIKAEMETLDVPILVVSSLGIDDPEVLEVIEAGADDYFRLGAPSSLARRRIERLLTQSLDRRRRRQVETRFQTLIESLPEIVYMAEAQPPYGVVYLGPQARRLGYWIEDGRSAPALWSDLVHPEDRQRVLGEIESARGKKDRFEIQYRVVKRDGSVRWIHDRGTLLLDTEGKPLYWQGLLADITERKRAEEELRRSEERYRAFVEQSSEAIWCFEYEKPLSMELSEEDQIEHAYKYGYLAECNDAMARMYGLSRADEIIGARLGDLLIRSDPRNIEYLQSFIRSGYRLLDAETREADKDGKIRYFLNNLVGVIEDGFVARAWGLQRDITESRQMEVALRASERRFRLLIEGSSDIITIITGNGVIRYESPSIERVLGYTPEELIEKSAFVIVHPDDAQKVSDAIAEVLKENRSTQSVEFRALHKDGSWRTVEAVGMNLMDDPVIAGIVVNSRDVTERKQMEAALRRSESDYRNLFENANDSILIFETDSEIILEANKKACETYGFAREELIGMSLKLLTKDVKRGEQQIRQLIETGYTKNFETLHFRKDGTPINILGGGSLIEYRGKTAVMAIARDITDVKKLQQQLIQADKLAALGQMIAGVAHELNNPLTSVIGFTQLMLLERSLDGQLRESLEIVRHEAERTRKIVQNLLSFSRQHKPSRTEVDINELLDNTLDLRAYEMGVNNISVHRNYGQLPNVMIDEHQMQQVFLNIIINAEHAMHLHHLGGTLTLTTAFEKSASNNCVRIIIEDDGPGIATENLDRLFDPFFTTKPVGQGTGLGLSIAYGIIKEHGGSIRVESSPGQGARFIIELPLRPA
ncbi:MAG TPA: PAS domain S-box protein [Blastocatellia bacterium]